MPSKCRRKGRVYGPQAAAAKTAALENKSQGLCNACLSAKFRIQVLRVTAQAAQERAGCAAADLAVAAAAAQTTRADLSRAAIHSALLGGVLAE